ncbi:MAG: hypothetical protein ACRD5M_12300 [Candidatus Acidiferrales bacterium]
MAQNLAATSPAASRTQTQGTRSPATSHAARNAPAASRHTPAEVSPPILRAVKKPATDDEILEISFPPRQISGDGDLSAFDSDEASGANAATDPGDGANQEEAAADAAKEAAQGEPEHLRAAFDANPELRAAWQDAQEYRETFSTPEEARAATALLADLNRMDALFFSGRAEDHAELARAVANLDPQAFASLAQAMNALRSHSPAAAAPGQNANALQPEPARRVETTRPAEPARQADPARQEVTPAQAEFFHATNASAVQGVVEAIEAQVQRLLPEGVSKSARNRVVGEIYRELDSTLRSNRDLSRQMRDAFRSGSLDADHQRAVVALITARARQALPGVAKRVLNEWTSTLVAANQERRTRQRTAERRVDIAGSGGAGNEGRRAMAPREIDYGRMSDADILNL